MRTEMAVIEFPDCDLQTLLPELARETSLARGADRALDYTEVEEPQVSLPCLVNNVPKTARLYMIDALDYCFVIAFGSDPVELTVPETVEGISCLCQIVNADGLHPRWVAMQYILVDDDNFCFFDDWASTAPKHLPYAVVAFALMYQAGLFRDL